MEIAFRKEEWTSHPICRKLSAGTARRPRLRCSQGSSSTEWCRGASRNRPRDGLRMVCGGMCFIGNHLDARVDLGSGSTVAKTRKCAGQSSGFRAELQAGGMMKLSCTSSSPSSSGRRRASTAGCTFQPGSASRGCMFLPWALAMLACSTTNPASLAGRWIVTRERVVR